MPRLIKSIVVLLLGFGFGINSSWGDTPVVQLPLIRYEGQGQGIVTLPAIVYKGPGQMNLKAPQLKAVPKLVLKPEAARGVFSTASRVPLQVVCSRDPGNSLQYGFQRQVNRRWQTDGPPRWLGPSVRQGAGRLTITRHVKFLKAGKYRWRCRSGQGGTWSSWSPELVIASPGTPAATTPARRASEPARPGTPGRSAE